MKNILETIFNNLSVEELNLIKLLDLSKNTDDIVKELIINGVVSFELKDEKDAKKNNKNK